ncbi:MAG TPA: hypothetical protein VFU54_03710, partial [Actinomycetota bacterium]|nr:hypothetical protein [Actinomycetota bacterium]
MARWWLAALTLVALVLLAVPAAAAGYVEDAAAGLRRVPVYVDQRAAAIVSEQGASELRDSVANAGTPIFIAVLPAVAREEAGGSTGRLAQAIAGRVGRPGAYMVISGDQWAAGNVGGTLPAGRAAALGTTAFAANGRDAQAALLQWTGGVAAAAREGGRAQPGGAAQGGPVDTVGSGDTGGGRGGAGGTIAGVAVVA